MIGCFVLSSRGRFFDPIHSVVASIAGHYAKFAATVFEDFSHVSLHCVHIITLHGNNGRTLNRHARLTHARINAEEVEELVSNLIQIRQNCPGSNAAATTLPDRVWMMFSGNFN